MRGSILFLSLTFHVGLIWLSTLKAPHVSIEKPTVPKTPIVVSWPNRPLPNLPTQSAAVNEKTGEKPGIKETAHEIVRSIATRRVINPKPIAQTDDNFSKTLGKLPTVPDLDYADEGVVLSFFAKNGSIVVFPMTGEPGSAYGSESSPQFKAPYWEAVVEQVDSCWQTPVNKLSFIDSLREEKHVSQDAGVRIVYDFNLCVRFAQRIREFALSHNLSSAPAACAKLDDSSDGFTIVSLSHCE